MLHNNYEVRVLVKGRPINEYAHNGQTFLEGRDGSNFEIEFKNLSANRIEAVLSVDGLSVIDGKEAGPQSSGYVVGPYETVRIPGWKLTDEQVAAFQFAGKKGSYAAQSTGSARNTGVIGALVFAEKRAIPQPIHHQYVHLNSQLLSPTVVGQPFYGAPTTGDAGGIRGMTFGASGPTWNSTESVTMNSLIGASLSAATPHGEQKTGGSILRSAANTGPKTKCAPMTEPTPVVQTLGTAFGEAQDFGTVAVTFNRGDLAAMIVIYYDDSRGLRARGIELTRRTKQRITPANAPQAFPAMTKGCTPPAGWNG